jgi:hypothetical protein
VGRSNRGKQNRVKITHPGRSERLNAFHKVLNRERNGLAGPAYIGKTYCRQVVVFFDEHACWYRKGVSFVCRECNDGLVKRYVATPE